MKKLKLVLNIILMVAIMILDFVYIHLSIFAHNPNSIYVKASASILFVLLAGINLIFIGKEKQISKFSIIMLVGLFFAMLGDIVLEIEFIVGAILFAVGHLFFFVSYSTLNRFHWKDVLFAACIFVPAVLIITLVPVFNFGKGTDGIIMEIVCVIYALIISLMVGKAISNYTRAKSTLNLIIMIGSILFFFSDFMLLFNVFASISRAFGVLCLLTYYPAEILLATSILASKKQEK